MIIAAALLAALAVQEPPPVVDSSYGCVACHADKRRAFVQGVHAERGIRCHDCHGGNPRARDLPAAHGGGFIGTPNKARVVALCGSCHSDPNRMRQFGLGTGQVAEFRTSRHGQLLLLRGNPDAPTCTSCHDAHTIRRPDDARSTVHPTNIAATCAHCHEDKRLMTRYGIPTDQVEQFRRSAHGVALYQNQNFAAPTCVGCHGSHSALPPGVTEIANVCARCHVLVGQAFSRGPHGQAARAGALPGCLGCHSNHGTERTPEDSIGSTCRACHAAGTAADSVGRAIQAQVMEAGRELRAAAASVERLARAGRPVSDAQFRYQSAVTYYGQLAEVQHALDLDGLEELGRGVRSTARDLEVSADVAEEQQWEHKLLLVPVWFLALSGAALAWLTLRAVRREGM